jgi:lysophospholipase L1-like esterase
MTLPMVRLTLLLTTGLLYASEDERPVVDDLPVAQESGIESALPTLHLVGDSTVRSGGVAGMWGWGERISPFFDPHKIHVVNHAIGGRSARTYLSEGRWKKVADLIKPGDFLIIQFGHNDQGRIGDPANKGRADGAGTGDETVEDTKPDGTKELVHTFGWYMAKFVADAQAKGATPILCSPIPHKQRWESANDFESIARWSEEVAVSNRAYYFNLTRIITEAYKKVGKDTVETFFADKGTHTNDLGARFNANCVIAGLKGLPGGPLDRFLSPVPPRVLKFSFGEKMPGPDWIHVAAGAHYSPDAGYGFEPGAAGGGGDHFTSDLPFSFSVKLAEGNYTVVAVVGNESGDSVTTVKSELRRLMLEKIQDPPGTRVAKTFTVNLRTPHIAVGSAVLLKDRERTMDMLDWDEKLTLEFNGRKPTLRSLVISPVDVPTIFIAGDSTVCDQAAEPWNSWGQMLPRFFSSTVAVANYAQSGESIRSSLGARRFDKVFGIMKRGDYLLVQFGHNDQKEKDTSSLAVYQANLRKIIARTRSLGGIPVLITSVERKGGTVKDTLGPYPEAVRTVAAEEKCSLIDLHAMSRIFYQALGPDLDKAFCDGTHHNNYGSYELAKCVIVGIQRARLPLAKSIVAEFTGFDPAKPDPVATFEMPASPIISEAAPLGN